MRQEQTIHLKLKSKDSASYIVTETEVLSSLLPDSVELIMYMPLLEYFARKSCGKRR